VKKMKVCYIYKYEDIIMKTTKHFEKERKKKRENGNIIEG
jgi:hypothetical protein